MTRSTGRLAIAALALGLATTAGAAPQSALAPRTTAEVPVVFTSASPDLGSRWIGTPGRSGRCQVVEMSWFWWSPARR